MLFRVLILIEELKDIIDIKKLRQKIKQMVIVRKKTQPTK